MSQDRNNPLQRWQPFAVLLPYGAYLGAALGVVMNAVGALLCAEYFERAPVFFRLPNTLFTAVLQGTLEGGIYGTVCGAIYAAVVMKKSRDGFIRTKAKRGLRIVPIAAFIGWIFGFVMGFLGRFIGVINPSLPNEAIPSTPPFFEEVKYGIGHAYLGAIIGLVIACYLYLRKTKAPRDPRELPPIPEP